jgi:hypothetical protein
VLTFLRTDGARYKVHGKALLDGAKAAAPLASCAKIGEGRAKAMTIEIHNPHLVQRLTMRIRTGRFHDADELIEKALDALDERTAATSPTTETGALVLAALQASPYPDIDLTPPRICLSNVREVML